jgi:hypothetical protein
MPMSTMPSSHKKLLHRPKPIRSSASQSRVAGRQAQPWLQPVVLGESACDMGISVSRVRAGGELALAIGLHYR